MKIETTGPVWAISETKRTLIENYLTSAISTQGRTPGLSLRTYKDSKHSVIYIEGLLSKYGGNGTLSIEEVRTSVANSKRPTLLIINSPGGSVSGLIELMDAVWEASQKHPVHAHIIDVGASAAWFIASQANRITATATAAVGSVGVVSVLTDTTGQYQNRGVKVRVVSSGGLKGSGTPGTPLSEAKIAEVQRMVDGTTSELMKRVNRARSGIVANGETYLAKDALAKGLIDAIETEQQARASLLGSRVVSETRKLAANAALSGFALSASDPSATPRITTGNNLQKEWENSPELRAEFLTADAYEAFRLAEIDGRLSWSRGCCVANPTTTKQQELE